MSTEHSITVTVNDQRYESQVQPRLLLSDYLRHTLGLRGTHVGCEQGVCGACTILFDGQPARACLMLAVQADGHDIKTIEGIGDPDHLHPLQEAFHKKHALQCGFCTPGFIMTLVPLLRDNPAPTPEQVRDMLSGNLCRCTGYQHINEAASFAAALMRNASDDSSQEREP